MESHEREYLIYRISAGYLKYKNNQNPPVFIYSPDLPTKYEAQEMYVDVYDQALAGGVYTNEEIIEMMVKNQLWSDIKEQLLTEVIPEKIDFLKVEIYRANTDTDRRERIRQDLRKLEGQLSELLSQKHQYDYFTCHGIATYAKLNFIIKNTSKYEDGKPCDWNEVDIHKTIDFFNQHLITDKELRDIAKNEPWMSIWASSKSSTLFNKTSLELGDDQRRLIGYSRFYDNIYEHHECPHESIVDDDDMLDGWVILQKKEREKSQNIKMVESKIKNSRIANSQEIFIPVSNAEDAKKIDDANDRTGKRIKQQRMNMLAQGTPVEDAKFADVKQDIMMKANEQYMNTVKGR